MIKFISSIGFVIIISCFSCTKPDQYSDIPYIEFNNLYQVQSVTSNAEYQFVINFQDGNGDIGYLGTDTVFNLLTTYYYKDKGLFRKLNRDSLVGDTVKNATDFAIPQFAIPSNRKAITGEISITIDFQYFAAIMPKQFDTIQLEFCLVDRANNKSNLVKSTTIILKN